MLYLAQTSKHPNFTDPQRQINITEVDSIFVLNLLIALPETDSSPALTFLHCKISLPFKI